MGCQQSKKAEAPGATTQEKPGGTLLDSKAETKVEVAAAPEETTSSSAAPASTPAPVETIKHKAKEDEAKYEVKSEGGVEPAKDEATAAVDEAKSAEQPAEPAKYEESAAGFEAKSAEQPVEPAKYKDTADYETKSSEQPAESAKNEAATAAASSSYAAPDAQGDDGYKAAEEGVEVGTSGSAKEPEIQIEGVEHSRCACCF